MDELFYSFIQPDENADKDQLEKLFIMSLLNDPFWLKNHIDDINRELFSIQNQEILAKIIESFTQEQYITRDEIEALFGKMPYPTLSPQQYYDKLLELYYRERSIERVISFMNQLKEGYNIQKAMRELAADIEGMLNMKQVYIEYGADSLREALSFIPRTIKVHRILDNVWGGGARLGEVYYLVARPKQGKSYFLIWLLYQMLMQGIPVIYLNMELPPRTFWERFISFFHKRDLQNQPDSLSDMINSDLVRLVSNLIIVHRPLDINELEQIYYYASLRGVYAILIDQLSHISLPVRFTSDFFSKFPSIVHLITQYSKKYNIFTFVLSQLNREEQVAYSDEIVKSADLVYRMITKHTPSGFKSNIIAEYARRVKPHQIEFELDMTNFEVIISHVGESDTNLDIDLDFVPLENWDEVSSE